MIAVVSHDIKNPLNAIQLEAQMLLRAAERAEKSLLSEEVKIQATRILKTTERMKMLITDLLDREKSADALSHIVKRDVYVSKLLQEVLDSVRPLIQEKEIILKTIIPDSVVIPLDRNKMFQVFTNLLSNALKFTPRGGMIQMTLEERSHDFYFEVEDTGPGLQGVDLNRVFDKFWSGSDVSSGTGLGLFICRTIIEAHGGKIFVENRANRGACFWFVIPKSQPKLEASDGRKKILIVDDDDDLREVISWALTKEGYSVSAFHSPSEALAQLSRPGFHPNLIVVDFHMDEMMGTEFVKKKREIPGVAGCPVVMISASPLDVESELSRDMYEEVITKPIDFEGLVSNVRRFLQ